MKNGSYLEAAAAFDRVAEKNRQFIVEMKRLSGELLGEFSVVLLVDHVLYAVSYQ